MKKSAKLGCKYRPIHKEELAQLQAGQNIVENPAQLYITNATDLTRIEHVRFSGTNYLGAIAGTHKAYGGVIRTNGIYHAHLHNCTVGNNPYIAQVKNYIANYHIGHNVTIEHIDILVTEAGATFGNGVEVEVINEGGGRAIPMYNTLSAQVAYILAMYRHHTSLIEQLNTMIARYVESVRCDYGRIGEQVTIRNAGSIIDTNIGDCAHISGVAKLQNGSINSCSDAPVYIGAGVMAENFIVCSDSLIDNASIISNCFVGQGCILDKHYSAEHSVFFANCQGFNGEACSIFAGPYTVTHHKSTLLIAGMFSFMNAGSGSNQSNHMYKLGPIHQGIMERGAKTTSDSYLLWPSKVGAFTLVMGRHYSNSDSSDLPFSYLIESKDESYLAPGVNLKSVGTVRDVQKWPKRDRRHQAQKLDAVNFNLLSPFTISKMYQGIQVLESLQALSGPHTREYTYKGMKIEQHALVRGIGLYTHAIHKFLGNSLISRLQKSGILESLSSPCVDSSNSNSRDDSNALAKNSAHRANGIDAIRKALTPDTTRGLGKWIDLGGMLLPELALQEVVQAIESKELDSIEAVHNAFCNIHAAYYTYEWTWAAWLLEEFYQKKIESLEIKDIIAIVEQWKESVLYIDNLLYKDAKKEFSLSTQVGFGMDGEEKEKEQDFASVRGEFANNSTVQEILAHMERKRQLGNSVIAALEPLL